MAVRITVELPPRQVRLWSRWASEHGSSADTMHRLARAGGSDSWFVSEQEIPADNWTAVETIRAVQDRPDVLRASVKSSIAVSVRPSWEDFSPDDMQRRMAQLQAMFKSGEG
jgi:hypothetical protein